MKTNAILICVLGLFFAAGAQKADFMPIQNGSVYEGLRIGSDLTADKPQSKCWYYGGKWWAVLSPGQTLILFSFDGKEWRQEFVLQSEFTAYADCFVDGSDVYILAYASRLTKIFKLHDAGGNYEIAPGWEEPVALELNGSSESATLVRDSAGVLWVAAEELTNINLYHSTLTERDWEGPVTVREGVDGDDIAVLTKLTGNRIAVIWSDQARGEFGMAIHEDGAPVDAWTLETAASGGPVSDDHINVALASDGTLYMAVKTEFDTNDMIQLGVLRRTPDGEWSEIIPITVLSATNTGTRPIVLLNEQAQEIYVFFTNWADSPRTISAKSSPLSNIEFPLESIRIMESKYDLNNVTSTKQNVDRQTGLMIMAAPANSRTIDYAFIRDFAALGGKASSGDWERY